MKAYSTTKNTKNKEKQKWKKVVQVYSIETEEGFTLYSSKLQDLPWREDFTSFKPLKFTEMVVKNGFPL